MRAPWKYILHPMLSLARFMLLIFKECGACFANACDSRPFDIHLEHFCPLCAPMASAPSLVCGMQAYSTVTLLGPGQDAKAYPTGKFWGFGILCDAKKRVRLVSSEPLWVFPHSVDLLHADVSNIGYFLNFRCDASDLSAHNSYLGVCMSVRFVLSRSRFMESVMAWLHISHSTDLCGQV